MNGRFVYLTHNPPSNVVFSQVVELIEALDRHHMVFDLVFLLSGRNYLDYLRGRLKGMAQIRQRLPGRVRCLPSPMLNSRAGLTWAARMLDRCFPSRPQERLVIHARNITSACVAARLKTFRPDVRTLFDVRGDKVSEHLFLHPDQANSPELRERVVRSIVAREGEAAGAADHIFCVSGVLKDLVATRTGFTRQRITVIPCCANDGLFHYDSAVRSRMRSELRLEGRFVLVYSGGMSKWHCADQVFAVAAVLMRRHPDVALLILTPERQKAMEMAQKFLPADRWLATTAARNEVAGYLSAADMGILIREEDPLSRVASPTKFAEYILLGLPVMISAHIGDYSSFVDRNSCGFVLPNNLDQDPLIALFDAFRERNQPEREAIARLGREAFAKERYAPLMIATYQQLYKN